MLKLDLAAVDRDEVHLREQVPPDHPMWSESGMDLAAPLEVDLTARSVGEGVLVRGKLRGRVRMACRRCLEPVEREIDDTVDLLFLPPTGDEEEDTGGDAYTLPARGTELDLTDAVREHVLLDNPEYALCREECRGLCPTCGTNLNEGACECVPEAAPSAWDALKKIQFD